MEPLPISPWFAWGCLELRRACAGLGLEPPSFRAPPATPGLDRALRRVPGEGVRVAIRLWGRPFADIRADMVEGVLAANRLPADDPRRPALEAAVPLPEARCAA